MPTSLDPQQYLSPTMIGGTASLLSQPPVPTPGSYPALGMTMRFKVVVSALKNDGDLGNWSSCKGLHVSFASTPVKEGGQYTSQSYLPERVEYGKITLERAMSRADSGRVLRWLRLVQSKWMTPGQTYVANDLSITLQDAGGDDVVTWILSRVCPVSWSCAPFATGKGGIAVETLELQHEGFL